MPVFLFCHPKDKDRILDIFNNLLDLKDDKNSINSSNFKNPHELSYD